MPSEAAKIALERIALLDLMDSPEFGIPRREVDENVILATWNIQQFNERKTKRSLQYIADICERFDIIALQEVKTDLRGLEKLRAMLPGHYRLLVTDPTGNSERFAFLYDSRTIDTTGLACEIGFNVPAKSHQGYQLHRMPYCASFRAARFDFVIVSVHIYYGKTKAEREQRRAEIASIADFVRRRSKTASTKVFDRDFFVMGDFNIEEQDDEFFKALVEQGFQMPPNMSTLHTNHGRTKTFDKIAWVNRPSFSFSGKCNVVPFGQAVYQDRNPKGGKQEISDHLPLWAEFRVNRLSQELDSIIRQG